MAKKNDSITVSYEDMLKAKAAQKKKKKKATK